MSRYQRFVAYVYEYQREKKGKNRGFVRVENKEGVCSFQIQLQSPGLIGQIPCRIYGFLRKEEWMEGIFLGECMTRRDGLQCEMEVKDGEMGESHRKLDEFGGMIFLTEGGGFYGTEWDDQGIAPEQFREEKISDIPELPKAEMTEMSDAAILKKIPEPDDWEKDEEDMENGETAEKVQVANTVAAEAEQDTFHPFGDGEIVDCKKMDLQEISFLNRRDWTLRNNRFLLYGYYHFGYLLIGRLRGRQQYVLGVPGMYDQQERFMANMFGFTHFKFSSLVELPDGKGGYWYRLINPPNFDQRNR